MWTLKRVIYINLTLNSIKTGLIKNWNNKFFIIWKDSLSDALSKFESEFYGFKKNLHKILMIYGQLLQIPNEERQNVDSIFLVGAVNTLYYDNIDMILQIIFNNLIKENTFSDVKTKIKYICGDTPILQEVSGCVKGVGMAEYSCRECYTHK